MGLWHGFGFWLDGYLKALFRDSPEVVLRAWAPGEFCVPTRFTFEGKIGEGMLSGDVVLAYGPCGPEEYREYMADVEVGKIVIQGLALRAIRHFLQSAGGATHVSIGVLMDIDREMPPGNEEIRVDELELRFSFSNPDHEAKLEIRGLGDNRVLEARIIPSLDAWRIYSDGEVQYFGLREKEVAEMPEWFEKALHEHRNDTTSEVG